MSLDWVVVFSKQIMCVYLKNWFMNGHILLQNFTVQHKHVWFGMVEHGLPRR